MTASRRTTLRDRLLYIQASCLTLRIGIYPFSVILHSSPRLRMLLCRAMFSKILINLKMIFEHRYVGLHLDLATTLISQLGKCSCRAFKLLHKGSRLTLLTGRLLVLVD